jgi:hypothetical protein
MPYYIQIDGLSKLQRFLREAEPFYARPWKEALERATQQTEQEAEKVAPVASGKLRASITHRMDARPIPKWGIVSTDATAADGTRSPFVLQGGHRTPRRGFQTIDTGKKSRTVLVSKRNWRKMSATAGTLINLHYRGTGRSTRGWLNKALAMMRSRINSILQDAERKIEREWSK